MNGVALELLVNVWSPLTEGRVTDVLSQMSVVNVPGADRALMVTEMVRVRDREGEVPQGGPFG
jgi:hypothetical protein